MSRIGSKERLRDYFLANIGRVLTSAELQKASGGASEFARRIRELRDQEGWPILTNNDSIELKPGEYLMKKLPPAKGSLRIATGISKRVRAQVFDRNGFTCQMCGLSPGDTDPSTGRMVRLHLGHIVDRKLGGSSELSNLRTLCSTCNQGAKNTTTEKPTTIWLLSQIRRAGIAEQNAAYAWLKKKFEK
jgi:hypothetical protein